MFQHGVGAIQQCNWSARQVLACGRDVGRARNHNVGISRSFLALTSLNAVGRVCAATDRELRYEAYYPTPPLIRSLNLAL